MRRTRIFTIVLFLIALAAFAVSQALEIMADKSGPEISMDTDTIGVSAEASDQELLAGVTAVDKTDGDVSANLMVESITNFREDRTRLMTIVAFDSDGNVTKAERTVKYTDYHAAQFTLDGPLRYAMGDEDILDNVGAEDQLDGDLSASVKVTDKYTIPDDEEGDFPLEFTVTNSAGDVSRMTVTVTIESSASYNSGAHFELENYIIYTAKGTSIDAMSNLTSITIQSTTYTKNEDGSFTAESTDKTDSTDTTIEADRVNVVGEVDYATPGTYELAYELESEDGKETLGSTHLIVVVTE